MPTTKPPQAIVDAMNQLIVELRVRNVRLPSDRAAADVVVNEWLPQLHANRLPSGWESWESWIRAVRKTNLGEE
jgi:hypothetical protein